MWSLWFIGARVTLVHDMAVSSDETVVELIIILVDIMTISMFGLRLLVKHYTFTVSLTIRRIRSQ